MGNSFTDSQWKIIKGLQCQICNIENNGPTVVVDNGLSDGSASIFGTGNINDPLYATANGSPSIYTEDGEIQSNRTVSIPLSTSLSFSGATGSSISLGTNSDAQQLTLGAGGVQLKSTFGYLNLAYSGGLRLVRGDDTTTNYSALTMAPGTSSPPLWVDFNGAGGFSGVRIDGSGAATGINFSRLEATGSVGGLGTNAKAQLTPTEFTIQRTIGAPPDIAVFTVNVNSGQLKLSTQYNSSAFLSVTSGGIVTKVVAMAAIADLAASPTVEEIATAFNTLLAELRTAGLLAT